MIAEAREIHRVEALIEPVRDMFSAIFFVAIGLLIDPRIAGVFIAAAFVSVREPAWLKNLGLSDEWLKPMLWLTAAILSLPMFIAASPGNSGLQFRSRFDDSASGGWLDGPQVDIHPPAAMPWRTGLIYDETRGEQRWIFPSLKDWNMDPKFAPQQFIFKYAEDGDAWNELTLICQGTRVKTILNGIVRTDWDAAGVLDNTAHAKRNVGKTGHFALQLHSGDELRIRFKDIRVKAL